MARTTIKVSNRGNFELVMVCRSSNCLALPEVRIGPVLRPVDLRCPHYRDYTGECVPYRCSPGFAESGRWNHPTVDSCRLILAGSSCVGICPGRRRSATTGPPNCVQSGDPNRASSRHGPSGPAGGPGVGVDVPDLVEEVGVVPVPVQRRLGQPVVLADALETERVEQRVTRS